MGADQSGISEQELRWILRENVIELYNLPI